VELFDDIPVIKDANYFRSHVDHDAIIVKTEGAEFDAYDSLQFFCIRREVIC